MVLTYHEAVEAGARSLADRYSETEDVVDVDRRNCAAVLSAVGYIDLLTSVELLRGSADAWWTEYDVARAEAENLRITVREDKRVMDRDAGELARLLALSSLWQSVISADGFEAAVNVMAQAYHESECAYRGERDALAATVARVEAVADGMADAAGHRDRIRADLGIALRGETT